MAVIVTYVCDASGVQGIQEDFVNVVIAANKANHKGNFNTVGTVTKIIHKDVAKKLNLIMPEKNAEAQPEPTLESKLLVLLKEYIVDIAYEAGGEAGAEAASNRN